ncbi:MAG: hypothetical protein MUF62_02780 [Chitinophagaceae bacterium]|jgi:hypothetical protein|nr:hypothetical protein [Chitinophagaceae bacterium]
MRQAPHFNFMGSCLMVCLLTFGSTQAQDRPVRPLIMTFNDRHVEFDVWEKVVEGSPFFNANWRPAALLLSNGEVIEQLQVKVNLLENQIHYLDPAGREMVTMQEVKSVIFLDEANDTSAVLVNRLALTTATAAPDGWMQLLSKGKATLLKRMIKQDVEVKGYGASTVVTHINTTTQYLLLFNGRIEKIQTLADIADRLENAPFSTWAAKQRGDKKSEELLKKAIDYFNSL